MQETLRTLLNKIQYTNGCFYKLGCFDPNTGFQIVIISKGTRYNLHAFTPKMVDDHLYMLEIILKKILIIESC